MFNDKYDTHCTIPNSNDMHYTIRVNRKVERYAKKHNCSLEKAFKEVYGFEYKKNGIHSVIPIGNNFFNKR